MKIVAAIAFGILFVACANSSDPKSPANRGQLCDAIASGFACPNGTQCVKNPVDASLGAEPPSLEGAACGGYTGQSCAAGLDCKRNASQENATDAKGTCVATWRCVSNEPCGLGDSAHVCAPGYD